MGSNPALVMGSNPLPLQAKIQLLITGSNPQINNIKKQKQTLARG